MAQNLVARKCRIDPLPRTASRVSAETKSPHEKQKLVGDNNVHVGDGLDARLGSQSASGAASLQSASPVVSLTDLPVLANKESESNKGQIVVNDPKASYLFIYQTYNGKPLMVGDKTYAKGLESIHGRDSWSYKAYTSLVMVSARTTARYLYGGCHPNAFAMRFDMRKAVARVSNYQLRLFH